MKLRGKEQKRKIGRNKNKTNKIISEILKKLSKMKFLLLMDNFNH